MGFPSLVCYLIFPKPFVLLFNILDTIRLTLWLIFHHLGLWNLNDRTFFSSDFSSAPYIFVPPSSIKRRLPIIDYGSFTEGLLVDKKVVQGQCAVCLEGLEGKHEVRKLGNCCHAFHVRCIDEWIDIGQVTCPLCRAQLLPNGLEVDEEC